MAVVLFYRFLALLLLIIFSPLFLIMFLAVRLTSKGPFLFKQKRTGKDKKIFTIYKIRTMVENADALKEKYRHLNELCEPIFKIRNDPRYTKVGKFLANSCLDELPQLINVLRGEMSFIGPRPLPVDEAKRLPKKYDVRYGVLPGIVPPWVKVGVNTLTTNEWLRLENDYVKSHVWQNDVVLLIKTLGLLFHRDV